MARRRVHLSLKVEELEPRIAPGVVAGTDLPLINEAAQGMVGAPGDGDGGDVQALGLGSPVQIPIAHGRRVTFQDDDGSSVRVLLSGPGQGYLTLMNGELTWAQVDEIVLQGTTHRSRLTMISSGGKVRGTSFNELIISGYDHTEGDMITASSSGSPGLGTFYGGGMDLASNGMIMVGGSVRSMVLRDIGPASSVMIQGDVLNFTVRNIGANVYFNAGHDVRRFTAASLGDATNIYVGNKLTTFTSAQGVMANGTIIVGTGGIGRISLGMIRSSVISSGTNIGTIRVGGSMWATSIAANIGPGADGKYGTADDTVLNPGLDGSLVRLVVRKEILGSSDPSQHYGVVTQDDIGRVIMAGRGQNLPWIFGNVTVASHWK